MKLLNPVEGVITSSFGSRLNPVLDNTPENHTGIDIAAPKGSGVVAVGDGVVSNIRYSETYGNVLEYEVSGNIKIMYAHLDAVLVEVGDNVKRGDVIAKSGDTGLVTGAHLHYSIYIDGKLTDPMPYVRLSVSDDVIREYEDRGDRFY